jgi:outer membrane protein OmpA-like peptidoglycan-associated protein
MLTTLALLAAVQATAGGQSSTGSSAADRAKAVLGKAADTAATSAASLLADTLLGSTGGLAPAALDANGHPACGPGLIAVPAQYLTPNGTAGAPAVPAVPSPGSALVGMAKQKLAGDGNADTTAAAAPASGYYCGSPEQVNAAMQQAQTGGAGAGSGMQAGLTSALSTTRQGALVGGAVAAAPLAGKAARKLGGMFGRGGGQTTESMQKDLAKGSLTMKKLRFVEGSDELGDGADEEIAKLGQALAASEGRFALEVAPEGSADADVALAGRRAQRVLAHLLVAGVPVDRLSAETSTRPVKRGDARLEVRARSGDGGTP